VEGSRDVPTISVVVPSFNRLYSLFDTLSGLNEQSLEFDLFEVIIVDNASTDGTYDAIQNLVDAAPYTLRVLRMPSENRGPAPARNFGAKNARGKIIAFTDSDCRPHREWLRAGLGAFEDHAVAFATGVISLKPEELDRNSFFARKTVTSDREHPTYPTANAFYRRETFLQYGGFSEALSFPNVFGMAVEAADTDLAWRIKDAGGENRFLPEAIVFHAVQVSSPLEWLLEPARLYLIPALVKRHPQMRQVMLSYRLFFYRGSIAYYLAPIGVLTLALTDVRTIVIVPLLLIGAAAAMSPSRTPVAIAQKVGRILMNAARIYVMLAALVYGSVRFGALVL
jgi:glycosyltransferase involved in cell wall biosynthesis